MDNTKRKIWEPLVSLKERTENGKRLRKNTPRDSHSEWKAGTNRKNPIELLKQSDEGRVEQLIPIRYGRMSSSPFAFLRGSAIVMASDLSTTPVSGIDVQCCGDCHLMNFGGYATAMRNRVFDINDFDETLPAPWEWDVKRLTASIAVAGRHLGYPDKVNRKAAVIAAKTYQKKINKYALMKELDIWYSRVGLEDILKAISKDKYAQKKIKESDLKARKRIHENVVPKLTKTKSGKLRIIDNPPLIYHVPEIDEQRQEFFFNSYFESIPDDLKSFLNRFQLVDVTIKVVGVGSVGTFCLIGLFEGGNGGSLLLQIKEARKSVLEQFTTPSVYKNSGERIVVGQRLMQASSDIFLGWAKGVKERDFYVRQLRDMKGSVELETLTPKMFDLYSMLCGWTLAKSHAKSGSSPEISGYLGKSDEFSEAIGDFSIKYADQTIADHDLLKDAVAKKIVSAIYETGK